MAEAEDVGRALHAWAKENGYLVNDEVDSPGLRKPLASLFRAPADREALVAADQLLARLQVATILHDDATKTVTVCTKGAIPVTRGKALPLMMDEVSVNWIGSCHISNNPPSAPPQPTTTKRSFQHGGRIACGSSVHPASSHGAGTFGCLVQGKDGAIYGMSNNHVTGGCNHMEDGMPILSPAAFDASPDPSHPVPETIGRHFRSIPLLSGDPRIVPAQVHDASIFTVVNPDRVSSMQGDSDYDTPSQLLVPPAGVRVKKVGRTTGLTVGTLIGVMSAPLAIPYVADRFKAHVYIGGGLAIQGDNGQPFSQPGDSGSLVVTEDGNHAVGLIMAGMGLISFALPIEPTLTELGVSLLSNHMV